MRSLYVILQYLLHRHPATAMAIQQTTFSPFSPVSCPRQTNIEHFHHHHQIKCNCGHTRTLSLLIYAMHMRKECRQNPVQFTLHFSAQFISQTPSFIESVQGHHKQYPLAAHCPLGIAVFPFSMLTCYQFPSSTGPLQLQVTIFCTSFTVTKPENLFYDFTNPTPYDWKPVCVKFHHQVITSAVLFDQCQQLLLCITIRV